MLPVQSSILHLDIKSGMLLALETVLWCSAALAELGCPAANVLLTPEGRAKIAGAPCRSSCTLSRAAAC